MNLNKGRAFPLGGRPGFFVVATCSPPAPPALRWMRRERPVETSAEPRRERFLRSTERTAFATDQRVGDAFSLERIRDSCSDDWVKRSSDGGGGVGERSRSVSDETFAVSKPTLHVSRMRSSRALAHFSGSATGRSGTQYGCSRTRSPPCRECPRCNGSSIDRCRGRSRPASLAWPAPVPAGRS